MRWNKALQDKKYPFVKKKKTKTKRSKHKGLDEILLNSYCLS